MPAGPAMGVARSHVRAHAIAQFLFLRAGAFPENTGGASAARRHAVSAMRLIRVQVDAIIATRGQIPRADAHAPRAGLEFAAGRAAVSTVLRVDAEVRTSFAASLLSFGTRALGSHAGGFAEPLRAFGRARRVTTAAMGQGVLNIDAGPVATLLTGLAFRRADRFNALTSFRACHGAGRHA